ncbi:hypothetical protein CYY_003429 [Polysphondylium violaceum]|uniref:Uncharacterized protein n=1 Tax=Polysphondylium violaceum TaxID=133409 RepID=A0A8J4V182_9MYCE|nr:hypothetical protein CYY_003429 [Polysphondylium violaceum]
MIPRQNIDFILIGDLEIIRYLCSVNKRNVNQLQIHLQNIYKHENFEEIMKLLEKSKMIDKLQPHHMDQFKTKRNLLYFIENDYQSTNMILGNIMRGTDEQVSCLSILLENFDYTNNDLKQLFSVNNIIEREYLIYREFFHKYPNYERLYDMYPIIIDRYEKYKERYSILFSDANIIDNKYNSIIDLPISIKTIVQHANSDNMRSLIKRYKNDFLTIKYKQYLESIENVKEIYSLEGDQDDNNGDQLLIQVFIDIIIEYNNLVLLKIVFQEYSTTTLFDIIPEMKTSLIYHAILDERLEILDYLFDQLKIDCPPPSLLKELGITSLVETYLRNKSW